MRIRYLLCLFLAMFLFPQPLWGQIDTGSIQGIVRDAQGAVIPGVDVNIINEGTNQVFTAVTNERGFYVAAKLKVGQYRVEASLPGFKTAVRKGLTLEVQATLRVDLTLELGEITDQVTVTGAAPLLQSEKSSVGQVVDSRTISDLPLNGRHYVQLARLVAGVIEPPRGDRGGAAGFVANGVRSSLNDFRLDGADNNARTPGMQQRTYDTVRPSVDAIQEFRVETHNFSAEFGRAAGAVVNVVTKSGNNEFHGSLFEFHRNDKLDARHFFSPPDDPKPFLLLNQFGGTIGGPIVRDKTFFFFNYEGLRERRGMTIVQTVPTPAMRAGDFSGIADIYDPATTRPNPKGKGFIRDPFPGNRIPADRINPLSKRLMEEMMLLPNQPGNTNNFILSPNQPLDNDQVTVRVDATLSDNDQLFGRYSFADSRKIIPWPFHIDGAERTEDVRRQAFVIGETHIFTPTTVNELRFSYSRLNPLRGTVIDEQLFEEFGFKGINPPEDIKGLPIINIGGFPRMGNQGFVPNQKIPNVYEVSNNLSLIKGDHALTAGVQFRYIRTWFNITQQARGQFNFNGVFTQNPQKRGGTGSEFADFLLGVPHVAVISNVFDGTTPMHYWGFFIQDDWKVTPRLTFNLGLRYELFYPEYEIDDKQVNFVLGPNKFIAPNNEVPEGMLEDLFMPIPGGVDSRRLRELDKTNFSPRIGLAYRLADRTVVRAGGGIFYAEGVYTFLGGSGRLVGNQPFRIRERFASDRLFPSSAVTFDTGFPPGAAQERSFSQRGIIRSHATDMPQPYASHWSLNLQHELPKLFLVDLGYNGSSGTNFNVAFDANQPLPGPGAEHPRRPIEGFGSITRFQSFASSNYHALVLRLERRFSEGLGFLIGYTYGKAIDDGAQQFTQRPWRDTRNLRWERSRSAFDIRHRLVASYIWDLPFGTNRRWDLGSPWLNNVLGNWQFNGITLLRTGQPLTPAMGFSTANTGHSRPSRTCDGNLPEGQRSIQGWFDKSCFPSADPTNFKFGNAGRNILDAPGQVNFDLSLFKRIPVAALGERGEVQFRVEFFNAFNTPQFGFPNARVDRKQGATIRSLSTNMREMQFGLKVLF